MHKAGFVNIFGKPNAGKSTLLNAIIGEKLAIISPKVQTTRHRITGVLTEPGYQVVFSDTPGIIDPKYKLHEKMMGAVKSALEDADVALLILDAKDSLEENLELFDSLKLKVPVILVLNKIDKLSKEELSALEEKAKEWKKATAVVPISAMQKKGLKELMTTIVSLLPEANAFYPEDTLTDRSTRFFVAEIIREKIFQLFKEEIPYHTTVIVTQFQEKETLTKITAEVIVTRETQKAIILGEKGKSIRELGTISRQEIEKFIERKVFLELFVKVRGKWRDNDTFLKEYGY
ncbi:GTP-binding protein Era [Chitinophaga terrae (ex Kim and Jung 2007)]|uniref:GTPase Era n=1 Tax=Chitinophaga terrae (ex Kim and Jung 2007) TaxID=408074 RepID=A0A1H4E2E2_9BACT|nr:GTPase Era [Chitinophaga terrae (ex Kim and Jung 2007)]MDQ0108244.1 GTP-binding protein Era [Chitinophaga terrae (ex Kim and Jung 2007)]GEP91452.1 GTPase Era [Chitinophaga terrae (ex Kim and Jung 2007)]SEA79086.1 GTP-binding protein Era [Chitinophaga terrae (ex Kim and Jung 2007)]